MKGTVVKLTIPAVVQDMLQVKLVVEAEDAVGVGFGGVEVVLGMFEWSKVFKGEVFWKAFDREVGKIVGHLMGFWRLIQRVFIHAGSAAD